MNSLIKYNIFNIFALLISFFIFSCEDKDTNDEPEIYTGKAEIEFTKTEHDFGTLQEGEIVECTFKYKNTGDAPLEIHAVTADCGCTIPEFSSEPVLPGEEGKITVEFNSSGFRNNIYKTIDVETNAKRSFTELVLTAFIENNNNLN